MAKDDEPSSSFLCRRKEDDALVCLFPWKRTNEFSEGCYPLYSIRTLLFESQIKSTKSYALLIGGHNYPGA